MLKQLACAAASSSSGVVLLAAPSVRAFQLRAASRNVPLPALVLPFPDIRSPSHCAVALLCMVAPPVAGALWQGELVVSSGVTDCYQPLEASYRLTRGCLEVCAEYRNPVGIITKSPLIERDLDVLQELHRNGRVSVSVSVPIWDREHAHAIEPYVATPRRRMKTIERLAAAGLKVGVNVAPVIPGLSDADIPRILEAAHAAGARRAGFVFLRLPGSVKQVFELRLRESLPLRADRVLNRVRDARGGKLYDARWGVRGRGEGTYAEAARALFDATVKRLGMNEGFHCDEDAPTFRRPGRGNQLPLL